MALQVPYAGTLEMTGLGIVNEVEQLSATVSNRLTSDVRGIAQLSIGKVCN